MSQNTVDTTPPQLETLRVTLSDAVFGDATMEMTLVVRNKGASAGR